MLVNNSYTAFKPQDSVGKLLISQACISKLTKELLHVFHVFNN